MDEPYTFLCTLSGYNNAIKALAFSSTGKFLATGGEDGIILIWDPKAGQLLKSIDVRSPVLCLEWDPIRRKQLFFGCFDGTAAFVDSFGEVTLSCSMPFNTLNPGLFTTDICTFHTDWNRRRPGLFFGGRQSC
jgi:WD40 repeat protein